MFFNNPGGKLKSYAKVLFWIGAVISILIGLGVIISSFSTAYYYGAGGVISGIIEGVIIAAIGMLISWISVLSLYALGVLVENSDELVRINGGQPSGEKKASKVELPKKEDFKQVMPTQTTTEAPVENHVCPQCGASYSDGQHFCKNCGNKLD